MISARFDVLLPPETWISEVSSAFPEATFRLLTGVPVEEGALELGEVVGGDVRAAMDAIRAHPDVVEYEQLHAGDERALAKYRSTEQSLYEFLRETSLPPEFPVVVEDRWVEFGVTAPREDVRAFRERLADDDWPHEVVSLVGHRSQERLLTDRQRDLLDAAVRHGYFEVPRECTLAELAADAGVDKSTASEVVRRGEARLVKRFLTGTGGEP